MKNYLTYKNYKGTIEYSSSDGVWYGKFLEINHLVIYEANSREDLRKAFIEAIDDLKTISR